MTATWSDTTVTWSDTSVLWDGSAAPDPLMPVVFVEVAFGDNPTTAAAALTWTDITDYVDGFSFQRGILNELDITRTGSMTVILRNTDRRFDPLYEAGPYFGNLLPMRRIRVRVRWDGTTYPVFSGLVESWPQDYEAFDATVEAPCVDLFKSLANLGVSASYSEELTGARIGNVLDDLGWPAADRDLDAGQSDQAAITLSNASALTHLQDVVTGENGRFFVARDGVVSFIDRHQLIVAEQAPTLVWGDELTTGDVFTDTFLDGYVGLDLPFEDLVFDFGDGMLWNEVTVSSPSLTDQVGTDSASQTKYFTRSLSRSTVLAAEDEMQNLADFLVSRFAEPSLRIVSMTLDGQPDRTWPFIFGRELGDKVRVRKTPPAGGAVIVQDSVIDGIRWDVVAPFGWRVMWSLSPVDSVSLYWVLDSSALDSGTRLAF